MNKKKFDNIWYMVKKELYRDSLVDLLEYWEISLEDYKEFEAMVEKLKEQLNDE